VCGFCLDRGEHHSVRRCTSHHTKRDGEHVVYDWLLCSHYSTTAGKFCQKNTMMVATFEERVLAEIARLIVQSTDGDNTMLNEIEDPRAALRTDHERVRISLGRLAGEEARWDAAYRQGAVSLEKYATGLRDLQCQQQHWELELATLAQAIERVSSAETIQARRVEALSSLATRSIRS
jgi:hypothetical protein